jgi:hypothetical protein
MVRHSLQQTGLDTAIGADNIGSAVSGTDDNHTTRHMVECNREIGSQREVEGAYQRSAASIPSVSRCISDACKHNLAAQIFEVMGWGRVHVLLSQNTRQFRENGRCARTQIL